MRGAARKRVTPTLAIEPRSAAPAKPALLALAKFSYERATLTPAQIAEAREHHIRWLNTVSRWLRVDDTMVQPEDRKLVERVMATVGGDGTAFERALGYQPVNDLFARGVLFYQRPA